MRACPLPFPTICASSCITTRTEGPTPTPTHLFSIPTPTSQEMVIAGVPTTIPYHLLILENEAFQAGDVDTGFIVKHGDSLQQPPQRKAVSRPAKGG